MGTSLSQSNVLAPSSSHTLSWCASVNLTIIFGHVTIPLNEASRGLEIRGWRLMAYNPPFNIKLSLSLSPWILKLQLPKYKVVYMTRVVESQCNNGTQGLCAKCMIMNWWLTKSMLAWRTNWFSMLIIQRETLNQILYHHAIENSSYLPKCHYF